jgi:hypothetical protein
VVVDLPTLTDKDIDDIVNWGIPNEIDTIAASFVRKGEDLDYIRQVGAGARLAGRVGGGWGWLAAWGRAAAGSPRLPRPAPWPQRSPRGRWQRAALPGSAAAALRHAAGACSGPTARAPRPALVVQVLGEKGRYVKIISKVENQEGIQNFDIILAKTDAVMVGGRGAEGGGGRGVLQTVAALRQGSPLPAGSASRLCQQALPAGSASRL